MAASLLYTCKKLKFIQHDTVHYDCFLPFFGNQYARIAGSEGQVYEVQQSTLKKWIDRPGNSGKDAQGERHLRCKGNLRKWLFVRPL